MTKMPNPTDALDAGLRSSFIRASLARASVANPSNDEPRRHRFFDPYTLHRLGLISHKVWAPYPR
jgi:hypothetical protein